MTTGTHAQDVSKVFDPNYIPKIFKEKQKHVYAISESKVLTYCGKAIVREHEATFDSQQEVKLTEHHLRSTKAIIKSFTILYNITPARFSSG